MPQTMEQKFAIELFQKEDTKLLLIDACAGSGKSFTLLEIAVLDYIKSGRCIVYNKSVADQNVIDFPSSTFTSSTIHSMAYQHTVVDFGLKVGYFNPRDIKERIGFENKLEVVKTLRSFCLSKHLTVSEYATEVDTPELIVKLVESYLKKMKSGEIQSTPDFYMKYFHMLLANNIIKLNEIDVLMLDEAQDSFATTIEIFKLIPAKKKIAVGDRRQALYSFNDCVNGFNILSSEPGVAYASINKSFRLNIDDAKLIKEFMSYHLNDIDYKFEGNVHEDTQIKSRAFLTKTNSALIGKMIELMESNTGFNMLRTPSSIFELPLILINLKRNGFIKNPEWRHIQDNVDYWYANRSLHHEFSTPLKYVASVNNKDIGIKTAINIIIKHSPKKVMDAFTYAKKHHRLKEKFEWTLSTVFTSKGFTFDYVELSDDINIAFGRARDHYRMNKISFESFNDILFQYYVVCTRHKYKLVNAIHLDSHLSESFNAKILNDTLLVP